MDIEDTGSKTNEDLLMLDADEVYNTFKNEDMEEVKETAKDKEEASSDICLL